MMIVSPGFIILMALTAAGLRTPSHTVVPSRWRSSIEYVPGSVFARKYAIAVTSSSAGGRDYRTPAGDHTKDPHHDSSAIASDAGQRGGRLRGFTPSRPAGDIITQANAIGAC